MCEWYLTGGEKGGKGTFILRGVITQLPRRPSRVERGRDATGLNCREVSSDSIDDWRVDCNPFPPADSL